MKRWGARALPAAFLILMAALSLPPLARHFLVSRLESLFPGASVSVDRVSLRAFDTVGISNITIARKPLYTAVIRRVNVTISPAGIVRGVIGRVSIEGARVEADIGTKKAALPLSLLPEPKSGGRGLSVGKLICSDVDLRFSCADASFDARMDCVLDPARKTIESIRLRLERLQIRDIKARDARAYIAAGQAGYVSAAEVAYKKLIARNIRGTARISGTTVDIGNLSADVLKGSVVENCSVALAWPVKYTSFTVINGIDLTEFAEAFELKEKVMLGGTINGALRIEGTGDSITHVSGNVTAGRDGGILTIADTRFLESMAQRSGSSLDIVMESFRNYRYNTGTVTFGLDNRNVMLQADLEGASGKRELTVVLHDIIREKERAR